MSEETRVVEVGSPVEPGSFDAAVGLRILVRDEGGVGDLGVLVSVEYRDGGAVLTLRPL